MKISNTIYKITKDVIEKATEYESITHRRLGITGEIGEILISKQLNLILLENPTM